MFDLLRIRPARGERGASSTEYALLAVLIAVAVMASVTFFGSTTNGLFQRTCGSIASAQSQSC